MRHCTDGSLIICHPSVTLREDLLELGGGDPDSHLLRRELESEPGQFDGRGHALVGCKGKAQLPALGKQRREDPHHGEVVALAPNDVIDRNEHRSQRQTEGCSPPCARGVIYLRCFYTRYSWQRMPEFTFFPREKETSTMTHRLAWSAFGRVIMGLHRTQDEKE